MATHFRHTIRAAVFCTGLLVSGFLLLFHTSAARPDPIVGLLKLPAPPPPNPLVHPVAARPEKFYDRLKLPDDNAPIEDLIDYWTTQSSGYNRLRYNPEPSDRVRGRLLQEVQANPKLLPNLLNTFIGDSKAADVIYGIYDREGTGAFDKDTRKTIRDWLTYNSSYFSQDLERQASQAGDTGEYVSNYEDLLALTHADFDRARTTIDRLYSSPDQKVGRVLAQWALYRHALESASVSDVDRYRRELQDVVEDKNAMPGARDLALDALAQEKDWSGRDEWYYSLLSDPTLTELRVNGSTYTGLTTMMMVAPPGKYGPKMIELLKGSDPVVRANVVRNLITQLEDGDPEVLRALLPWLDDEKWAKETGDTRAAIVRKLAEVDMPEAVPGLIKVLEEKRTVMLPKGSVVTNANVSSNTATMAINDPRIYWGNRAVNAVNRPDERIAVTPSDQYPYRSAAVYALTKQKDPRAVPALKRTLNTIDGWERDAVVKAIFVSAGFTISEQLDALETAGRGARDDGAAMDSNATLTAANTVGNSKPLTPLELRRILGAVIMQSNEVSDELARAVVSRIEDYDKRDPSMAQAYRKIVLGWPNAAVNILFLRDTKRDSANVDTIVRLVASRKQLREHQQTDVSDLRTGTARAIGIAACIFEDKNEYDAILDSGTWDAKAALLACGRLIRAPLNVSKVVPLLNAKEPLLAEAADTYLASEDSPAARAAVLARHPGEARILGGMTAFSGAGEPGEVIDSASSFDSLAALFQSIGDASLYNGWAGTGNDPELEAVEKRLQDEVRRDTSLVGIYAYDRSYIRIYPNKAVYSFEEDESRYHERQLTKEEFEEIKSYLAMNRADELPPFLYCGGQYCTAKELLMIGRNGGRRVYIAGDGIGHESDFFAGLDKFFEGVKKEPATLKYALSREIPGLEIVYASDGYNIATVWGDINGVSVAAGEKAVRSKIKREIAAIDDPENASAEPAADDAGSVGEMSEEAKSVWQKRRWEGYGWFTVGANNSLSPTTQPAGVDFITPAGSEQGAWKARIGSLEVRATGDGLFKVQGGRSVKIDDGSFSNAVVSPDGRWAFADKAGGDYGSTLVRVDLTTRRVYPVVFDNQYGEWIPRSFLPGTNTLVVERNDYGVGAVMPADEDGAPESPQEGSLLLIDATNDAVLDSRRELWPFAQVSFRPLQHASKAGELWAAIPDGEKNATDVGIIDSRTFTFKPLLHVPKIRFDSMRMWVDEPHDKVYLVYRGHLLSLPLKMEARTPPSTRSVRTH
jgi:hypothetical protein